MAKKSGMFEAGKEGKYGGHLGKNAYGRSVPGFLERGSVPKAEARSYASWNQKKGPDSKSTVISLPDKK